MKCSTNPPDSILREPSKERTPRAGPSGYPGHGVPAPGATAWAFSWACGKAKGLQASRTLGKGRGANGLELRLGEPRSGFSSPGL